MLSKLLILSSVFAFASAACPNRCSGHGNCGSADICECHPRWQGPDCSERQCPFGRSWSVTQDDTYSATVPAKNLGGNHAYTECSSKGTCDRTTGECQCFEGYSGRGCRRMACPNDCSGHGRCVSVSSQNASYTGTNAAKFGSQTWDMDGAMFCACDRGYESNDCSSRICPKGDDPVTDCSTGGAADANSKAHTMTQRLYVETTANDGTDCLSEASNATRRLSQVDPTLYASAKSDQQGSSSDEVYLKRMDGSTNGRKCLHGENSVDLGGATGFDNDAYTAGHFYGYISLKYTDMFGGEYFTRPILIDTSNYATMQALTDVPAFETSYNDSSQTGGGNNMDTRDTTQRLLKMSLSDSAAYDTIAEVETLAANDANIAMGHLADVSRNAMLEGTHNSANALKENLKRYTADRIRSALEELPNFAIPRVNVTNYYDSSSSSFWGNVFDIQFTDDATSGKQNLLECVYSSERACPGAQPRMANADPFGARKHGLGYTDKEKRTHQGTCMRMDPLDGQMKAVSGVTTKEDCQSDDGGGSVGVGGQCMNCKCGRGDDPTSNCNTGNGGQCYADATLAGLTATTEEACNALNGNKCTPEMIAYYKQGSGTVSAGTECDTAALPAVWVPNVWVEAALPINGETTFINYCNVYEVPLSTGKDYEENAECSNRGLCDSTTGQCACFDGHTGEACSTQTVFF